MQYIQATSRGCQQSNAHQSNRPWIRCGLAGAITSQYVEYVEWVSSDHVWAVVGSIQHMKRHRIFSKQSPAYRSAESEWDSIISPSVWASPPPLSSFRGGLYICSGCGCLAQAPPPGYNDDGRYPGTQSGQWQLTNAVACYCTFLNLQACAFKE